VLSPCVLPLLPLVLGTAASEHKLGPAALKAGLVLSLVALGLFVATAGFAIGLDVDDFRTVAEPMQAMCRFRRSGRGDRVTNNRHQPGG